MLDEYTGAFARYLRTGTVGALSDYCGGNADPARLRVYRNGFLKACVEALRAGYPSVERLVGGERFPALARPYVEAHPPRVASLVEYGEDFPRFVEDARDLHRLDYLASFATLDRAWSEVWFAEDTDPLETGEPGGGAPQASRAGPLHADVPAHASGETEALDRPHGRPAPRTRPVSNAHPPEAVAPAGISGDAEALVNLRGRLAPWVRLTSLRYRVLHAWIQLRQGALGQRTEVRRAPQHILLWRSGADVLHRDLTCPEHAFIAGVAAGRPCGEAAGAALDVDAEFNLVETFASLLHHHILAFGHRRPAGRVDRRSGPVAAVDPYRRPGARSRSGAPES